MIRSIPFLLMIGMTAALTAMLNAGEYNDVLSPGDAAPAWKDLPGIDGKTHSLADFQGKEAVVVVFMCVTCPAVADYEERLLAFARKHAGPGSKVGLVAINVSALADDKMPQMKERAKEAGYTFPYIFDETQKTAKLYGAQYTPEFFVLDKDRKIAYMGALDDKDNPKQATKTFLDDAVAATLAGKTPAVRETLARGCRIAWARVKKSKS